MKIRLSTVARFLVIAFLPILAHAQTQPATPSSDQANLRPRKLKIKPGGRDDLAAIGTRKIDGWDWYSPQSELELGRRHAQQLEAGMKFIEDPAITEYVNRLGQELVRNSDAKAAFTIKVVDSDEPRAYALPGGFLYVNSGLLSAVDNEAQLAGVMAHAIAHVAARHVTRMMTRAQFANYMTAPLIFAGGKCNIYAECDSDQNLGLPITFLKDSRAFEAEADYFGIQYLYKTGYDPGAFVSYLEKREPEENANPRSQALMFATHPPLAERARNARKEIAAILPPRDNSVLDTPQFQQAKSRLTEDSKR